MSYSYDIENFIPIIREQAKNSSFVLEIGPAKGNGSTLGITEGLSESIKDNLLFISVDQLDYMDIKPKVDYWHLVMGDSRDIKTLKKVQDIAGDRKADFIFIDTHHTYEQMAAELPVWVKMAHKDTVWMFHDTYMMGEYNHMTDAIKEFAEENNWEYFDFSIDHHGLGGMRKK